MKNTRDGDYELVDLTTGRIYFRGYFGSVTRTSTSGNIDVLRELNNLESSALGQAILEPKYSFLYQGLKDQE